MTQNDPIKVYPEHTLASSKEPYSYGTVQTLFGEALLISRAGYIVGLGFTHDLKELISKKWPMADYIQDQKMASDLWGQIINHDRVSCVLYGTDFQKKVWQALLEIKRGEIVSYKDIALKIGHPKAVRAVGTAIGANSLAYLIPCHRVLSLSGKVGDYRWGSELKKQLIQYEKSS